MTFSIDSGILKSGTNVCDEQIPSSVKEIAKNAFYHSPTLKKISFEGTGLVYVREYAFAECANLEEADFSICSECQFFERMAFSNCNKLKTFAFPPNINFIGGNAFRACKIAQTFNITRISCKDDSFLGNPLSFSCDSSSTMYQEYKNNIYSTSYDRLKYVSYSTEVLELHPSTTIIGSCAFGTSSLKEVILPSQITDVKTYAFHFALYLEHLVFSPNVKNIVQYTLNYNPSLKSLIIPNGVENIGSNVLSNCLKIRHIKLPDDGFTMKYDSFKDIRTLRYVTYNRTILSTLVKSGFPKRSLFQITCKISRTNINRLMLIMTFLSK